jgi:hypothetical protein
VLQPPFGLGLFYEIHDISRFAGEGEFLSHAGLIRPLKTSAGKVTGGGGSKIGNAHLKWAFSEAACLLARESDQAKRFLALNESLAAVSRASSATSSTKNCNHSVRSGVRPLDIRDHIPVELNRFAEEEGDDR